MRTELRSLSVLAWLLSASTAVASDTGDTLRRWARAGDASLVVVLIDGLRSDLVDATGPDGSPLMPAWAELRARAVDFTDCLHGGPDPTQPWTTLDGVAVTLERLAIRYDPASISDETLIATDPAPWDRGDAITTIEAAQSGRLATARLLLSQWDRLQGQGVRHRRDREWLDRAAHATVDRELGALLARHRDRAVAVTSGLSDDPRAPLLWAVPGQPGAREALPITQAQVPLLLNGGFEPGVRRWSVWPDGTTRLTTAQYVVQWSANGATRLHDLAWDPRAQVDIAAEQPDAVSALTHDAPTWLLGSSPPPQPWASARLWETLAGTGRSSWIPSADADIWTSGLLHPRQRP